MVLLNSRKKAKTRCRVGGGGGGGDSTFQILFLKIKNLT